MMSQSDFENMVSFAEDRHAELLAQARQQQLLKEAQPARLSNHPVWHWLHHAVVDRLPHIHLHRLAVTRHSAQHH